MNVCYGVLYNARKWSQMKCRAIPGRSLQNPKLVKVLTTKQTQMKIVEGVTFNRQTI